MGDQTRMLVDQSELIEIGKHLERTDTYYVAGSYSIFVRETNTKYMLRQSARRWPNLDGELVYMLPGEAARTEMRREWPELNRVGWTGPMIKLFDKSVPLHYEGPCIGEGVLVDLTGAYHQIYSRIWLDVCYPLGYYGKYPLHNVGERLKDWKAARNALVGIARARKTIGIKGTKRYQLSTTNPFLSPGLWATIQETLHWVARLAISNGAIYVNTDGYIFPYDSYWEWFMELLTKYDFKAEIRAQGSITIVSWNNYAVGSRETKPYKLNLYHHTGEFSNVRKENLYHWGDYLRRCSNLVRSGVRPQDKPG